MDRLGFRAASIDDVCLLARMNRELIVDEGSCNPMDHRALTKRMRGWLENDWRAIIFLASGEPAGYCLYQERGGEYSPNEQVIYIRQYYVVRERRREGIGRRAFHRIAGVVFADEAMLELDVLADNKVGWAFWASLGFAPHQTLVRRRAHHATSWSRICPTEDDVACERAPEC